MPSTSPGDNTPSTFTDILPGAPTTSLQTLATFVFRHKRYIAYTSGRQLSILSSPTTLVQALIFPDDLIAIASESTTGKVAVASKNDVWVLEPHTEGWTKVWWEKTLFLVREDATDKAQCLSWGNEGELLVGGSGLLSLFSTLPSSRTNSPALEAGGRENLEGRRPLWCKEISSAVQYAAFSPSAELIATSGVYDRLVKIWRRLSFEEGLFDYTYLPHPGTVAHLQWRPLDTHDDSRRESGITGRHEDDPEILYTIAADGLLRVWRTGGLHDLDILVVHTTVDLGSAIPDSPSLTIKGKDRQQYKPARYTFTIPAEQFCDAVTAAIGLRKEKLTHSLEHLKETASQEPDLIITLDGHGRMSAWGLQSIGHKRRPETPTGYSKSAYHIAHTEGLPLKIKDGVNARFEAWFEDAVIHVLVHHFDGSVQWWTGGVENFFSPSASGNDRVKEVGYWSGHAQGSISGLKGSLGGNDMISSDGSGNIASWTPDLASGRMHASSHLTLESQVLDTAILPVAHNRDAFIAALVRSISDQSKLDLVLCSRAGKELGREGRTLESGDDEVKWSLHCSGNEEETLIVALSSNGNGFVYCLETPNHAEFGLRPFTLSAPESAKAIVYAAAVLDSKDLDRVGFVCVDQSGALLLYHLNMQGSDPLEPAFVTSFETGNELAVVNLRDGYVEHHAATKGQIRQIVPSSTHHLVAVGYDTEVHVLAQGRYEHHEDMPAWTMLKRVSIAGIGLKISDLAWLSDCSLAIAAGNGICISSSEVPVKDLQADIQEAIDARLQSQDSYHFSNLSQQLKKRLPVWHPSLLAQTVRDGHWTLASTLVHNLCRKLKFWSEGDDLHSLLDVEAEHVYQSEQAPTAATLDDDLVADLMQQLEEKDLPEVSQKEQQQLKRVIQAMAYCSQHVSGLDGGALRFLFAWKLELLHMSAKKEMTAGQPNGVHPPTPAPVPTMHWREITFAHHSTTQQPLLDVLIAHYDNKLTWPMARSLGLFAWLVDRQALEQTFEALAQSAYRSASPADPINASLYFLAMHKKPALLALWRIATWHKEQRATMNFLRRDFGNGNAANRTAAKKNAYALMGKKRFDYAAAFFLLAEDPASATSVLASQCEDVMLAIAVARLHSGDGSGILRKLVEDRLMSEAAKTGDRWLTSWCHSILLEHDYAAEALVQPLEGLVRTWEQDDPATLALYRGIRKGAGSEYEYEAVLRAARVLRRMGLSLLALELVSRWEFKTPRTPMPRGRVDTLTNGVHEAQIKAEPPSMLEGLGDNSTNATKEPPSMLDAFDAPKPAAAPPRDEKAAREAKAAELLKKMKQKKEAAQPAISEKKPEPTQFKEPDANSLLDSFGF
ncbi:regulator of (H+)-ATPase in vacuolar membrane [Saxophila tyrrhenica]|uniref:Regulator of (H+)-ATPase in vacuolar membrane n=1 Tax=Saxophila tyrrhenica TaxID=1690608 RepID=A0AAV9PPS7_9PEZI|nr:regulator of (H+)-ATPase in vacuolar membrane [Saxophila tyrrhenica]